MPANFIDSPFGAPTPRENTLEDGVIFEKTFHWKDFETKKVETFHVRYTEEDEALIGYLHRDSIEEHEGWEPSTHDIVDMMFTTDESTGMEVVDKSMLASLNRKIKDLNTELGALRRKEDEIRTENRNIPGKTTSQCEDIIETLIMLKVDLHRAPLMESLQKNKRIKQMVEMRNAGITPSDNGLDFARAKQFPITDIIKFDRSGFACCVWHQEKTASMKYYKKQNKVHCFGCGKGGDAVDVAQAVWNCDIKQAVAQLTK